MAQINYDVARGADQSDAFAAFVSGGPHTLSGVAGFSIDNTATRDECVQALMAAVRAVGRAFQNVEDPTDLATSGSSTE